MTFLLKPVPADKLQEMLSGGVGDRLEWRRAPSQWVVDDDTGNFLYLTYWGDSENRNLSAYVFSWGGNLIPIFIETNEIVSDGAGTALATELNFRKRIDLPVQLEQFRTEIQEQIAAALKCYKHFPKNIVINFI